MFTTAIAECVALLQELGHEAEYYSLKGMCADDFAYYAERLTETEHHLAYLQHLQAVEVAHADAEAADFAIADGIPGYLERPADVYPAQCAYCLCALPGVADGTTRWCSEACWEMATAPGYYNAATEASRVTGEGYTDTEPDADVALLEAAQDTAWAFEPPTR